MALSIVMNIRAIILSSSTYSRQKRLHLGWAQSFNQKEIKYVWTLARLNDLIKGINLENRYKMIESGHFFFARYINFNHNPNHQAISKKVVTKVCKRLCKIYMGYINSVLNPLIYAIWWRTFAFLFLRDTFRHHWPLAFVNDEFQQNLRRAIREFGVNRARTIRVSVEHVSRV